MCHQSGKDEDLQIINRLRVEKLANHCRSWLWTMAGGHHCRRPSLALPVAGGLIGSADRKPAERRLTTL